MRRKGRGSRRSARGGMKMRPRGSTTRTRARPVTPNKKVRLHFNGGPVL